MQTYIPNQSELERIVQQAVADAVSEVLPEMVRRATAKEYLTKDELMQLTGFSSRTIQNLRDTRQIPFSQHGKKILYPYDGIMAFLKENHIKPNHQ